jgi:Predicted membrane protein (DUF2142)
MAQSESNERKWVLLLCLLAGVHVFVFSAAFPLFNNMDEIPHFDLVVKYSHGHLPRGLEPMGEKSSLYTLTYNSPEYTSLPENFPGGKYPTPAWRQSTNGQPEKSRREAFQQASASWQKIKNLPFWTNYESSQQPLYYAVAGLWWRAGQWLGIEGLRLVYWVRFLNILFVAATVWVGYAAARLVFQENFFMRLGVPAIIAFMPQQAFYSIQNDVLSPLCFGIAFILIVKFSRAEIPGARLGAATGLALAATFLAKLSNLPLLVVAGIFVALKFFQIARGGKFRAALPALACLILCVGLPVGGWMAWTKHAFGDFTGSAEKLQFITWTLKPFNEWWHHPLFTPQGLWTFISGLLVAFWQGEFQWHEQPLDLPLVDALYVILTLCFLALALVSLLRRTTAPTQPQRRVLWLCFGCFSAGVAFDFGLCRNPSREHPYFIAGRLILGALIPFLLLFLQGINYLLRGTKNSRVRPAVLASLILFMLVSEIITDWPVFSSQYNWYHF